LQSGRKTIVKSRKNQLIQLIKSLKGTPNSSIIFFKIKKGFILERLIVTINSYIDFPMIIDIILN